MRSTGRSVCPNQPRLPSRIPCIPGGPSLAWENGQLTYLNGQLAVAMTVSGSDTYVLGVDNSFNMVVWKNGAVFATLGAASNLNITCMVIAN